MGLPTEADLQSCIGKGLILDKELFANLSTASPSFVSREAAFLLSIPSDSSPGTQAAQQSLRAALAQAATGYRQSICAPLWATYARVRALPVGVQFFAALFRDFAERGTPVTVKNRAFSFGSFAADGPGGGGANSGTGLIYRLTKDQFDYTIESGFAEVKRAECVQDANSGTQRHQEVFMYRGKPAGRDGLERIGTGIAVPVTCLSPQSSSQLVPNPSFENVIGSTGALTEIVNWTPSAIGSFDTITSDIYRDVPNAPTSRSLRISANATLRQNFSDIPLGRWNPDVPLYAQIAFKRESSCDGNLNIIIGNVTATVALVAQSGWTILTFPITTNAWFRQWNKAAPSGSLSDAAVTISLTSRTTGTLLIDDFIIGPYTPADGAYVVIVGGQTPFLVRDAFVATDTSSDTGLIQTVLARQYGTYLPHTSGSPVWVDPT